MLETLELFGWDIGITAWAALALVVGALVIGFVAQYIGEVTVGYEWSLTTLAALAGGWLGSEAFGAASAWGPEWEGLYVLPAVIGAVLLAAVVDLLVRSLSGGSLTHHQRPV